MQSAAEVIDIEHETAPWVKEEVKALTVSEQANALTITDKISYEAGRELLLNIKDLRKQISDTFKPIIDKANQAHKEAIAQQRKVESPLIEAEGIIKNRIGAFLAEEERKRRAEEDRLRKIAEQEAEERRLAEAIAAEAEGDTEGAEAILDDEIFVPPPIVPKTVTTGGGISMREVWQCRVENLMQLVQAVAEGKVPLSAVQANTVFLGQQARSLKSEMKYPGVTVFSQNNIAAGRR